MRQPQKYRQKAKSLYKKCKCGETKQLEVHHKDSNPQNDNLLNLEWVCSVCHDKIHGRNKPKDKINKKYKKGTKRQHKK